MVFPVSVPDAPGVPAVAFAPGFISASTSLLTADTFTYFEGFFGPQWGIFLDGIPIVTADTVSAFDYRKESVISDYPLEEGSFESYDKVQTPADARFRFTTGGSADERQAMLDSIIAIEGDLNLYDIVTPEEVYSSFNIRHQDYRRTAQAGVGMLTVDVWCTEIRVATASYGSTAAPSGATPENGGTTQPVAPSAMQATASPYGDLSGVNRDTFPTGTPSSNNNTPGVRFQ